MTDFKDYDDALEKYSGNQEGTAMPLHSWDFFGDYFDYLKLAVSDLSKLEELSKANRWKANWNFSEELLDKVILVTDMDLKIVFASENIIQMTGYSFDEVIGKSPKIFQGEKTSAKELQQIRKAIDSKLPFDRTIINYKKNGETYSCHIKAFPVFNKKNEVVNFIAFENAA